MPVLQVTSSHPTTFTGAQAGVPAGQKFTVKNVGKNTVFYQFGREASSGDKAGELAEGASVEAEVAVSVRVKEPANPPASEAARGFTSDIEVKPVVATERRLLDVIQASLKESEAVGIYAPVITGGVLLKLTGTKLVVTENAPSFVYIDPVALATAGKQTQLTLTLDVTTNAVAPTASFIGGLYKLTKSAGGTEKKLEYELDPILAGSATPTITTPAKESNTHAEVTFAFAGAAGLYVPCVETITATTAAKSLEVVVLSVAVNN